MANIYVGTYAKYNEGSLFGEWIDPSDYSTKDDFIDACMELHDNEDDPELMFQDWEDIPDEYISESGIEDEYWDYLDVVDRVDEDIINAGLACGVPLERIEDAYYGQFDSDTDLAYEYIESTGELDTDSPLARYFDYEAFGRDLAMYYIEHNGYYFHSNW